MNGRKVGQKMKSYNKASQSDLRKLSSFLQKKRKKSANSLRQLLATLELTMPPMIILRNNNALKHCCSLIKNNACTSYCKPLYIDFYIV
jgi:hypothetical protein